LRKIFNFHSNNQKFCVNIVYLHFDTFSLKPMKII